MALAEAPIDSADDHFSHQEYPRPAELLGALEDFVEKVQAELNEKFADFSERKNQFFEIYMPDYVALVVQLVRTYQSQAANKSIEASINQALRATDDLLLQWPSGVFPDGGPDGPTYRMNRQSPFFTEMGKALSEKTFSPEELNFPDRVKAVLKAAQKERGIPVPAYYH